MFKSPKQRPIFTAELHLVGKEGRVGCLWYLGVNSPEGGYGVAYYGYVIYFSSTGNVIANAPSPDEVAPVQRQGTSPEIENLHILP